MRPLTTLAALVAVASGAFVDDIRSLATLHNEGVLTDAEYAAAKARAIAAAFPAPAPHNASDASVMIDCGSDSNGQLTKVLTVVLPYKLSTPLDLRRSQDICGEVIGYGGFTEVLTPIHVPQAQFAVV